MAYGLGSAPIPLRLLRPNLAPPEPRQRFSDSPIRLGRNRHPAMARLNLHVFGGRVETRVPIDDAVAARIDRDVAHAAWEVRLHVPPEALAAMAVATRVPEQAGHAKRAERAHREHRRTHERMHRQRIELRRAERHDPRHEVRPPYREHAREVAAAALADDR